MLGIDKFNYLLYTTLNTRLVRKFRGKKINISGLYCATSVNFSKRSVVLSFSAVVTCLVNLNLLGVVAQRVFDALVLEFIENLCIWYSRSLNYAITQSTVKKIKFFSKFILSRLFFSRYFFRLTFSSALVLFRTFIFTVIFRFCNVVLGNGVGSLYILDCSQPALNVNTYSVKYKRHAFDALLDKAATIRSDFKSFSTVNSVFFLENYLFLRRKRFNASKTFYKVRKPFLVRSRDLTRFSKWRRLRLKKSKFFVFRK